MKSTIRAAVLFLCVLGHPACKKEMPVEQVSPSSGVAITSPGDFSTVIDSLVIQVTAISAKTITRVELFVDGKLDSSLVRFAPPYSFVWTVPAEPDSTIHTLQAKAVQSDNTILLSSYLKVIVRSFAPSDLRLVAVNETSMSLSWVDNCRFETGFLIERSVRDSAFVQVDSVGPNTTARLLGGPFETNANYSLRVQAVAPGKASKFSNVAKGSIRFAPPSIAMFRSPADSIIVIGWRDSSMLAARFEIERSTDGVTFSTGRTVDTTVSFQGEFFTTFRELFTMDQEYFFRLRGVSKYNRSRYSVILSTTPHFGPPSPPRLLSATDSRVSLTWDVSGRFAREVMVERSGDNQPYGEIGSVSSQANVFTDSSLNSTVAYQYRIRGSNGTEFGDYSQTVGITFARNGTYSLVKTLVGSTGLPTSVFFTANDGAVVVNGMNPAATLWDIQTGSILRTHTVRPFVPGWPAAVSASDHYITISDSLNTIQVYDAVSGGSITSWPAGDGNYISASAISPDEKSFAAVTVGTLYVYKFPSGEFQFAGDPGQYSVAFSPDNKFVGTGSNSQYATVFNVTTGERLNLYQSSNYSPVRCVRFNPDGQQMAAGGDEGNLYIWRMSDGMMLSRTYTGGQVYGIAYSPDGSTIATAGYMDSIKIWRSNGTVQAIRQQAIGGGVCFSHDGRFLICGLDYGMVAVYEASGSWQLAVGSQRTGSAVRRPAEILRRNSR